MKNIHVLPTDKLSRLFVYDGKLGLAKQSQYGSVAIQNQKIYITNDEEIKVGDWLLKCKNINDWNFKSGELEEKNYSYFAVKCVSLALINTEDKKIILTTDQDLINVQTIDDEFLEWFVKNPSCKEVKVEKQMLCEYCGQEHCDRLQCRGYDDKLWYEIIIPQKEPKQETLDEAAVKYSAEPQYFGKISGFRAGAKWQQEKLCDSEVIQRIRASKSDAEARRIIKTI